MLRFFIFLFSIIPWLAHANEESIRINQLGYYPDAAKIAIAIGDTKTDVFSLLDEKGETVFEGKLGKPIFWAKSEETARKADFSDFSKSGRYRLKIDSNVSWPFSIQQDVWNEVSVGLMKSYYLQRASMPIEEKYAGIYQRKAGHPDTDAVFHPSTGKKGRLNAPGGWYDAGDFGKYIVSASFTIANMMSLMELVPNAYPDGSVNIPESGNGISDLLDEVRYELEWMKKMQDSDGGVFVKMTTDIYPDMMFPHTDPLQRNVYGKSTASALNFSAAMAMAYRLFTPIDSKWAKDCLERSERAWKWARKNPNVIFTNPEGVLSGAYSNSDMSDEFLWAASELLISTEKSKYKKYLMKNIDALKRYEKPTWPNELGLGIMSLVVHREALPKKLRAVAEKSIKEWSDKTLQDMNASAYQVPEIEFTWGSNGDMGAAGLSFIYTYQFTGDKKYLDAAAAVADYILGKNATGYNFVTGFGSKQVVNLHHSVSIADGIPGSLPGFIPGGPNANLEDAVTDAHGEAAIYASTLPAKAYVDSQLSYSSNENDILYTSPNLALITALHHYYSALSAK